jgi:hypothetical protein
VFLPDVGGGGGGGGGFTTAVVFFCFFAATVVVVADVAFVFSLIWFNLLHVRSRLVLCIKPNHKQFFKMFLWSLND